MKNEELRMKNKIVNINALFFILNSSFLTVSYESNDIAA